MKKIKHSILFLFVFANAFCANAQTKPATGTKEELLNTAAACTYMSPNEREMIFEINRLRHDPVSYLQYILPLLNDAKKQLKINGKGDRNYSLTFSTTTKNGNSQSTIDTTWHYANVENLKALQTLANDLKILKPLTILVPDSGIYLAAKKHATDQQAHDWTLMHTGSDGSSPWDRITLFSPSMSFGNENIGGRYGYSSSTARDMILQLLIDAGIPGYGHRYNILNPQWTHIGCHIEKYEGTHWWWIQNFGYKK